MKVKTVKKSGESNATVATTVNSAAMRRAVFGMTAIATKLSPKRVKKVLIAFFKDQSRSIYPLYSIKGGPYDCPLFRKQCEKIQKNHFKDCPLVIRSHKGFNIQTWLVIKLIAYHAKVQQVVKRGFNLLI